MLNACNVIYLESEINLLDSRIDAGMGSLLEGRRKVLSSFLHEQTKEALIRSCISNTKDMDVLGAFFQPPSKSNTPEPDAVCSVNRWHYNHRGN